MMASRLTGVPCSRNKWAPEIETDSWRAVGITALKEEMNCEGLVQKRKKPFGRPPWVWRMMEMPRNYAFLFLRLKRIPCINNPVPNKRRVAGSGTG